MNIIAVLFFNGFQIPVIVVISTVFDGQFWNFGCEPIQLAFDEHMVISARWW
jgi:hypothetical protein